MLWVFSLLVGCTPQAVKIDVGNLADMLYKELAFEDQLAETNESMIALLYGITKDDVVEFKVYLSAGATTEEIAVFACANEELAARVKEKAEKRLTAQKNSVKSYKPEELERLDEAILQIEGTYVILCVSSDKEKAQAIIDNAMT